MSTFSLQMIYRVICSETDKKIDTKLAEFFISSPGAEAASERGFDRNATQSVTAAVP